MSEIKIIINKERLIGIGIIIGMVATIMILGGIIGAVL